MGWKCPSERAPCLRVTASKLRQAVTASELCEAVCIAASERSNAVRVSPINQNSDKRDGTFVLRLERLSGEIHMRRGGPF